MSTSVPYALLNSTHESNCYTRADSAFGAQSSNADDLISHWIDDWCGLRIRLVMSRARVTSQAECQETAQVV